MAHHVREKHPKVFYAMQSLQQKAVAEERKVLVLKRKLKDIGYVSNAMPSISEIVMPGLND